MSKKTIKKQEPEEAVEIEEATQEAQVLQEAVTEAPHPEPEQQEAQAAEEPVEPSVPDHPPPSVEASVLAGSVEPSVSVGRIVFYAPLGASSGKLKPAIVTEVKDEDRVDLVVFGLNGQATTALRAIRPADTSLDAPEGNTWSWPRQDWPGLSRKND